MDHQHVFQSLTGKCKYCDRVDPAKLSQNRTVPVSQPYRTILDTYQTSDKTFDQLRQSRFVAPPPQRAPPPPQRHITHLRPPVTTVDTRQRPPNAAVNIQRHLPNTAVTRQRPPPPPAPLVVYEPKRLQPLANNPFDFFDEKHRRSSSGEWAPYFEEAYSDHRASPVQLDNRQNMKSRIKVNACFAISTLQLLKGTKGIRDLVQELAEKFNAMPDIFPQLVVPFNELHLLMTTRYNDADGVIQLFSDQRNTFLTARRDDPNTTHPNQGCELDLDLLGRMTGAEQQDTTEYIQIFLQFFTEACRVIGMPQLVPFHSEKVTHSRCKCACGDPTDRKEDELSFSALVLSPDYPSYTLGSLIESTKKGKGPRKICLKCFNKQRELQPELRPIKDGDDSIKARLETNGWTVPGQFDRQGNPVLVDGWKTELTIDYKFGPVAIFQLARFREVGYGQYGKNTKVVEIPLYIDLPVMLEDQNRKARYRLKAMTRHIGHSMRGGHFICAIASDEREGDFYVFDNTKEAEAIPRYTFNELKRAHQIDREANLFTYERV